MVDMVWYQKLSKILGGQGEPGKLEMGRRKGLSALFSLSFLLPFDCLD